MLGFRKMFAEALVYSPYYNEKREIAEMVVQIDHSTAFLGCPKAHKISRKKPRRYLRHQITQVSCEINLEISNKNEEFLINSFARLLWYNDLPFLRFLLPWDISPLCMAVHGRKHLILVMHLIMMII